MTLSNELHFRATGQVRNTFDAIAAFVHEGMMCRTQAHAVIYACRAAIRPMLYMVDLQVASCRASGELTMLVAGLDGADHRRRPDPGLSADVDRLTVVC